MINNKLLLLAAGLGTAWFVRTVMRRNRYFELRSRTVLVTGGSRGLGLVMARELIAHGARVAICARDSNELYRARQDLQNRGGHVLTVPCDVTDQTQVQAMVRSVEQTFGHIEMLINNAAIIQVGPLESMTIADFEEAMRTNFWGPLYTTLAVLPEMRRHGEGRIVNISSIGGKISVPHLLPYSASKFALTGLSEGLRAELAKDNIFVTTVCPHLTRTGSPPNVTFKGQHRLEYTWFSLGDSLAAVSIDADQAARNIIEAGKYGDAELILSLQANLAIRLHTLFPNLGAEMLFLVNQLLPGPGGVGTQGIKGKDSHSALSPSWLTRLGDEASRKNNELAEFQPAASVANHR